MESPDGAFSLAIDTAPSGWTIPRPSEASGRVMLKGGITMSKPRFESYVQKAIGFAVIVIRFLNIIRGLREVIESLIDAFKF
jgi:hypothetical protein